MLMKLLLKMPNFTRSFSLNFLLFSLFSLISINFVVVVVAVIIAAVLICFAYYFLSHEITKRLEFSDTGLLIEEWHTNLNCHAEIFIAVCGWMAFSGWR